MRTRNRLLWTFLCVHVGITLAAGAVASFSLHIYLRRQAEASAQGLARVLDEGGFSMDESVRRRMEQLTGYDFEILTAASQEGPGTIQAQVGAVVVRIDYRTPEYRRAQNMVWGGTLIMVATGVLIIALLSWWLAAGLARPLERLAASARAIGAGDLDQAVPAVGGGEVALLAADLESMRRRLHELTEQVRRTERLETLGLFTATVAHEVRNPLSAVRLTVQLLRRRYPSEEAIAWIESDIERLDLIVDELVSYSRGMRVEPRPVSVRPLVADVFRLLARQAEHVGVELAVEGEAEFAVDPDRLRQLLLNLVLNAIQVQPDGGAVDVVLHPDGLEVRDRGPGVDPALADRLFDPFSSGRQDGTGLGLHLAAAIASAHGARLEHVPGDPGATFRLSGLAGG